MLEQSLAETQREVAARAAAHEHLLAAHAESAALHAESAALHAESAAAFRQRISAQEETIATLTRSVDEYKTLARHLHEENERLKRGLLGQKAERFSTNEGQLSLAMLELAYSQGGTQVTPDVHGGKQIVGEHIRGKAKRKPLPEHLP